MRYAIGAVLSGLFIIGLLLCCESMAPAPSESSAFDKGYNAGFQMGTEETLKAAVDKGLGEFYFDQSAGREAFHWFVDGRLDQTELVDAAGADPATTDVQHADQQHLAKRTPARSGSSRRHKGHKLREARVDAGRRMELTALRVEGV